MPINRDLEKWFDFSVDPNTRTIYMGSAGYSTEEGETGVDHVMAEYLIKGIHLLESTNQKPILILMNNPGGDWYHGMAIYDAISCSPCVCTIRVYGYAMSMGSIILQAADERVLMPNARLMIHYGSDGLSGHSKIFERWADESKRTSWEMENLYIEAMLKKEEQIGEGYLAKTLTDFMAKQKRFDFSKPTKPKRISFSKDDQEKFEELREIVKEMLKYDTILNAEEAVKLGLADSIYTS